MIVYFLIPIAVGMLDYILCYFLYSIVGDILKSRGKNLPKIDSGIATIIIVCVAMCFNMVVLHGIFPSLGINLESFHVSENLR